MKKFTLQFVVLLVTLFLSGALTQTFGQTYDRSSYDYWQKKMIDPNQNFNQLVDEFDNYWKGKEIPKHCGYKQFKRWQMFTRNYIGADGKKLPPEYTKNEHNKYKQEHLTDAIVGTWSFVGPSQFPAQSFGSQAPGLGRISSLAFHPTDENILFAGAPAGGLWKTTNGGNSWFNLNTDDIPTMGVSSIAVKPDSPNTIYIGTGDRDGNFSWGLGVYYSVDGGLTWVERNNGMGNLVVNKLLISDVNPNMLFAATHDGIYKTVSHGGIWSKMSGITGNVKELVNKPGTFEILYASAEGKFYKSTDYGQNWYEINYNSDKGHRGVIAVSPNNPDKVYFFVTKDNSAIGFYVSYNSGENFTKIWGINHVMIFGGQGQGGYNLEIAANPNDIDVLYVGMVNLMKSTDGGLSWALVADAGSLHADQHILEYSPVNNDLYIGNDGGVYKYNGLWSYEPISDGLGISEIYRFDIGINNPDLIINGQQDCGTYASDGGEWHHVNSGDGINSLIDYSNTNIMYGCSQTGPIVRSTSGGTSADNFHRIAGVLGGTVYNGLNEESDWELPMILDVNDPAIMFAGFENIWRSNNVNTSNHNDISWVNLTNDNLNTDYIDFLEQSPVDPFYIYVIGHNSETIFRLEDVYSQSPTRVQLSLPAGQKATWFEAHPTEPGTIYMTTTSRIYKSTNYGNNWINTTGALPNVTKRCIVYQNNSDEGLYVGTTIGVFYKDNSMPDWVRFKSDLPVTLIKDLKINYSTSPPQLFVATFGRGIWKTEVLPSYEPNLIVNVGNAVVTNTEVNILANVFNEATMATSGPSKIGYYLSTNEYIYPISDILIGEDNIGALDPENGQLEGITVDVALYQPAIASGTYYIGAYADKDESVAETNENDNSYVFSEQVTIPGSPLIPLNVQASDGTYFNKVVISWDPPSGATGTVWYRVFRNTYNNPNTAVEINTGAWMQNTSYWDLNTDGGIDYYYWIKAAYNYLGLRPSAFSIYNKGWEKLGAPTNVQASDGVYEDKIKITWQPPEGATHFKVYRNTVNNFNTAGALFSSWTNNIYYYDYTVGPGTTYYYWVKAAMSTSGLHESPNHSDSDSGWIPLMDAPIANATDGFYTDKILVTWNNVLGATHYQMYWNYTNDPLTAMASGNWQTETQQFKTSIASGWLYYFWVKAATDQWGNNATGFGEVDSGWANFDPIENVEATDGTSSEFIQITWNSGTYEDYYMVYRGATSNVNNAIPVSDWVDGNSFNDCTASPSDNHYFWVRCSGDNPGEFVSNFSDYDIGWQQAQKPVVQATHGVFNNKIVVTWDPLPGANSFRIYRSEGPYITDTLTNWSSTLNYDYEDYSVNSQTEYRYWVQGAYNNYGYKPSELSNSAYGMAGECGNLKDDPNYRSLEVFGNILEISARIYNEGPHDILNPSEVAYLVFDDPNTAWDFNLGTITVPPLDLGEFFEVSYLVNLDNVELGGIPFGMWYVGHYMPWDYANCESNFFDNLGVWDEMPFHYTDALYGTYTIGGSDPDFANYSEAVDNLINRGISADVIFEVRPEIYYEQISIPSITGTGPERTIMFKTESGYSDTAEINFSSNIENYVVQFDGAKYITFDKIKITSPGFTNYQSTYGRCIEIFNGAENIAIKHCRITGSTETSHLSDDMAIIYCGSSFCNDISFDHNNIENGSWSVYIEGQGAFGDEELFNISIENNVISGFAYKGIYMKDQKNPVVRKNIISYSPTPVSQCKGIELYNIENGFTIEKNKIIMQACDGVIRGIDLYSCNGSDENRGFVVNNFIAINSDFEEPIYGLSSFICTKFDIYHNSISLSGETYQETFCIYLDCSDEDITHDNNVKNNIFFNQSGGYAIIYGDEAINHSYITEMDYNDLYTTGTYLALYGNTNQVPDFNTWKAVSEFDTHSVSGDPLFISQSDLHVQSAGVNDVATPLSSVQIDIDEDIRHPLYPDIGADEFTPPPPDYDIYVNDIIEPITGYSLTDQETITIEIYNIGSQNVSNFPVSYNINSENTITETVTETLNSFEVLLYSFATKADLSEIGTYTITASTELPADENNANDSYTATVINLNPYNCIPLYGIGCSSGDYIDDFHISSLYHTESGCSENGYGDFTNMATNMTQGQSYQMELSLGYDDQYVSLWIDFNDDLIFEDEEKLVQDLYCENGGQTYSSMAVIPNSTLPGPHRMRVRCAYDNFPVYPCNFFQYGEAHDYTVEIFTGGGLWVFSNEFKTDCPETPVTISIDAQGGTQPYSYLWCTGETTETILVSPEITTGYKVFVTDYYGFIGTDSVYVNVNAKPSVTINAPFWDCEGNDIQLYADATAYGLMKEYCNTDCELPTGYCPSTALFIDNSIVEEVVLNTINNNSTGDCATYSDFTSLSTTLVKNEMYDMEVTLGTCGADNYKGAKIFVDWNRDGDFEDFFEDVAELWPVDTTYTHYTMIWVPNEAVLGNTIMRIVAVETWDTWSISPCGNYNYGETEDYTINIADTSQNQIISYDWTGPDGYTSTLQNPVLNNVMPADSGYYKLIVSDGNLCTNSDSLYIWIQASPFADAGPDATICEYMIYQANPVVENYMGVIWATDGSGYFDTTYIESPSYYASWDDVQSGSVDLTIIAWPNYPCMDSASSTLTLSFQQMPFADVPPGDLICGNENYQVSDVSAFNYASLYWTTNGTGNFSDSTVLNPLYFPGLTDIENGFVNLILNLEAIEPCSADSFYLCLMIQQEPFAYAGEDTSICSNGTLSILYAEVEDYDSLKWFTSGTGTFTDIYSLNPEYFPSLADIDVGTVDLSLVAYPMIPCSDSIVSSFILNISQETFAFAGGFDYICENNPYLLSEAEASGYSSLLWETSGMGYFDNPNELNPVYYPGENETGFIFLSLTAFGTPPCGNSTDYFYLEITPAPQAYIDDDVSICEGDYYTFVNDMAYNYAYIQWETNGLGYFDDPYNFHPTYYPATGETGEISISLTAYGISPCEETVSSMILNIEVTPSAYAGESGIICENESYFLAEATASNYSALFWETTGFGYFDDPYSLNPTYFPSPGETGFVELFLTAYGNAPCNDAFSVMSLEIIVAPLAFAGEEAIICENESYFLADAIASNYSYLLWETSGNGYFDNPNALNPTYFPGTGETGFVELSLIAYGNSPCSDAFSVMSLEIIAAPLAFAGEEAIICENESYFLAYAIASNYSTLLWETNGNGYFDDPNILNPTYFPGSGETGFIELSLTAYGNSPCVDAFSVLSLEIIVAPLAFAGNAAIICENESYFLSDATALNYSSLIWETSGSGYFDDPNALNPTYFPGSGETGFVELSLTAFGNTPCADAFSFMTLEIIATPLSFAGDDAIICENESYLLANATASNYSSLLWETNGSGYFDDPNTLNPTYFPGTGETGFIELSLTAYGNSPCTDAFSVMNLEIIAVPLAFAGQEAIICENESYFLSDAIASNYSSLLWETNGSGSFDDPNALNPTYFPGSGETGFIELSLTAYGNSPCTDAFSVMNLEIIAAPLAFTGQEAIICENESYFLSDALASNYSSLFWETNGSGYFDDPNALNPNYYPGAGETGFVELSLTAYGNSPCSNAFSVMNLEIIATPLAFAGQEAIICENESYFLADATASNYSSLFWETTGSGSFDDPNALNPTYFPGSGETGFVELSLTAYGYSPCAEAFSVMNLEVIVAPLVFAGNEAIICENESYFLAEATASNYADLFWQTDGYGYFDDPNALNPTYFPSLGETGFIELSLTAYGNSPCTDAFSVMNLEIIAAPLAFAGNEAIICESEPYFLAEATASNYSSLLWETSGIGYFDDPNALNPTYYPGTGETGFIELSLTAYGYSPCAEAFSIMNLEIIFAPLVFAGNEAIICENESYFLSDATASNYSDFFWETNGIGYFDDPNILNPTYFPGTSETGFVELSLTAYGNSPCAEAFSVMNLEIMAAPLAFAGNEAIICENEYYFLAEATASNYSTLLWETNGIGYFDDPNILNPTYFPGSGETGFVELSLTAFGNTPCAYAFSVMNLEIIVAPTAYAGEDATIMEGEAYFIYDATASNYESLEWATDGSGYFDDPNTLNPTYFPGSGETGTVVLSLNVDGFTPCSTVYSSMNLEIIGGGYPLNIGYQFVSSRIIPYSPNMLDVLANNLENIDFIRNSAGQMLRKIGPIWINSIGDWITTEGYLFRMINPDLLTIYGSAIDPQTPIGLALGYQMISYLPEFPINTYDVFSDVLSNLAFVRNTAGLMFRKIGPVWINGIGDMQAGEGYLVKMNADDVLIYPETTDNLFALKTPISEHYKVFGGNPYDPVWTIYFEQGVLNIGDEIGVYDGVVLAGAGIVVSENILENSIPVFSNLYESGNYPIFKIWNKNEEILLTDYSYLNPYGDAYMEEIFPETDGEYSMLNFSVTGISDNFKYASLTIYPNPSDGIFNISIERVSGDLQCKVIDLTGNEYRNFEFTGITGFTVKQLDLSGLPAGVYFISFTGRNLSRVEKIVIN